MTAPTIGRSGLGLPLIAVSSSATRAKRICRTSTSSPAAAAASSSRRPASKRQSRTPVWPGTSRRIDGWPVVSRCSSGLCSSSWSFSPGRGPVMRIGDIGARVQAREPDHALGQFEDGQRLPHLQHVDVALLSQHPGLQDQLDRLLHAHEEPGHVGIGDGHRSTGGDLALEGRDDAAPAAQHVPEPHRAVGQAGRRPLDQQLLTQPLGGPHDAGRPDRLVGRDQHEALGARGGRGIENVASAQDVDGDPLDDVGLEDGDMFEGGGVENHLGSPPVECPGHRISS